MPRSLSLGTLVAALVACALASAFTAIASRSETSAWKGFEQIIVTRDIEEKNVLEILARAGIRDTLSLSFHEVALSNFVETEWLPYFEIEARRLPHEPRGLDTLNQESQFFMASDKDREYLVYYVPSSLSGDSGYAAKEALAREGIGSILPRGKDSNESIILAGIAVELIAFVVSRKKLGILNFINAPWVIPLILGGGGVSVLSIAIMSANRAFLKANRIDMLAVIHGEGSCISIIQKNIRVLAVYSIIGICFFIAMMLRMNAMLILPVATGIVSECAVIALLRHVVKNSKTFFFPRPIIRHSYSVSLGMDRVGFLEISLLSIGLIITAMGIGIGPRDDDSIDGLRIPLPGLASDPKLASLEKVHDEWCRIQDLIPYTRFGEVALGEDLIRYRKDGSGIERELEMPPPPAKRNSSNLGIDVLLTRQGYPVSLRFGPPEGYHGLAWGECILYILLLCAFYVVGINPRGHYEDLVGARRVRRTR